MTYYTKDDLKEAFEAGSSFSMTGGDDKESPNFEHWFENVFCIVEGGHEWIDNPTDLGRFYCKWCSKYK